MKRKMTRLTRCGWSSIAAPEPSISGWSPRRGRAIGRPCREGGHAEAVADAAERLAAGEGISGFVIGHDGVSVDKQELARVEQHLEVAAPRGRLVLHRRRSGRTAASDGRRSRRATRRPSCPCPSEQPLPRPRRLRLRASAPLRFRAWSVGRRRSAGSAAATTTAAALGRLVLVLFVLAHRLGVQVIDAGFDFGFARVAAVDELVGFLIRERLSGSAATRLASSSASACMKSLFMRNRRCSGTVVVKRFSALMLGAGKSKICRYSSSL